MHLSLIDKKENETINLFKNVSVEKVNMSLLYEVVENYLANNRRGTACTKLRSEVSGGGIKPWRQKGTGRARAGSIRSPLWRGGGVVFGPRPRDFGFSIPRKKKKLALIQSLVDKNNNSKLYAVEKIDDSLQKTKEVSNWIKTFEIQGTVLLVVHEKMPKFERASKNIPYLFVLNVNKLNVYDIMYYDNVILLKDAVEFLNTKMGAK